MKANDCMRAEAVPVYKTQFALTHKTPAASDIHQCMLCTFRACELCMIPEAVCRETSVEFEEALFSEGLDCTVNWALVGVCSICQLVHFLNAGFDKVEG